MKKVILHSIIFSMALLSIPLLSILGTMLAVSSGNNSSLLLLFIIIPILIALATFLKRLIPAENFPWLVLAIASALLFHISLISSYLVGYDVHLELNFLDSVIMHSRWVISIPHEYNAMLSITILPTIYSHFLNMDGTWIFKIVYPLIYSLVPVALFQTYRRQTTPLIALLSAFLFMSYSSFYLEMQGLARQMIAELFLALLLILIVDREMNPQKRRLLSLIFSVGLVISHYAVACIFMFFLVPVWLISLRKKDGESLNETINTTYVNSFIVMLLSWYTFVASSKPIDSIIEVINRIPTDILGGLGGGVVYLSPSAVSFIHEISAYVFYIIQIFIVLGVIKVLLRYRESKFDRHYFLMSLMSLGVLVTCVFFPYLAQILQISRIYHLMLIFLAPYSILGGETVFRFAARILHAGAGIRRNGKPVLLPVCIILIIFLLFQSGFLYEVFRDPQPISMPLSGYRVDPLSGWGLYGPYTREQEVLSARWLSQNMGNEWKTYADLGSMFNVLTSYIPTQYVGKRWEYVLENNTKTIPEGAYIYLRYINLQGKMQSREVVSFWDIQDISNLIDGCNSIYSNGESIIYRRN